MVVLPLIAGVLLSYPAPFALADVLAVLAAETVSRRRSVP
jgi:hypothetical protein